MKNAYHALAVLAILHIVAAAGFVGWLAATNRLNRERVAEVKDTFTQTIAKEKAEEQRAKELEKKAKEEAERQAQLAGVGGLASTAEKLAAEKQRNELILRRLERTRREIESLSTNLHLARQRMERQREKLLASRKELEQRLKAIESRLNDEGFKKTVQLYETLPADQVKSMFIDLMEKGKTDQVVAFIEAMQVRKAGKVLKEFEEPEDVGRAVELTERLRARGSDLVEQVENTG